MFRTDVIVMQPFCFLMGETKHPPSSLGEALHFIGHGTFLQNLRENYPLLLTFYQILHGALLK
jgi:hypothetical protein